MYPRSFSVRFHRGPHRSVPHGAATSIAASKSRPGTILSDVARSQLRITFWPVRDSDTLLLHSNILRSVYLWVRNCASLPPARGWTRQEGGITWFLTHKFTLLSSVKTFGGSRTSIFMNPMKQHCFLNEYFLVTGKTSHLNHASENAFSS